MKTFIRWLKAVIKDKDGQYSINRPFFLIFMLIFLGAFLYLTIRNGAYPEVPASVQTVMLILLGYETAKKIITVRNGVRPREEVKKNGCD